MSEFIDSAPDLETYWRSIILFGRNVASYKFALAKSLFELGSYEQELIRLEDLAVPFAKNVCEHLNLSPKQSTSRSSKFLDACRAFNSHKFAKLPSTHLLARLHTRNEFLIGSHHPLRETLMSQTGNREFERKSFLQNFYDRARERLIHTWNPVLRSEPVF